MESVIKKHYSKSQSHCTTRMNQYSKCNDSSLHGCREICVEKSPNNWTNTGRISRRRMVLNLMIKKVVINLHTKYEHSSAHSCRENFDEKCHSSKYGWKENWTNK